MTPHRRQNLLTGDWVLVSPQRASRPWQGAAEAVTATAGVTHDPTCYLCAGVTRVGGVSNPDYTGVYVFDNDFPALLTEPGPGLPPDPLLVAEPQTGICRVICYSPDHSRTLARMETSQILEVVKTWAEQFQDLAAHPDIAAVTIFENRGEMMGASNPHPHGQIWATSSVPNELEREARTQADWLARHGEPLLMAYLARELAAVERIVHANDHFVALVPWWAAWPFETLILPRRAVSGLDQLSGAEQQGLADILGRMTATYDRLFQVSFPYTMGLHQRPVDGRSEDGFVLHVHFYPPLLRSATVRKFMVGFEMLAMPQRDLTPEAAAERLRALG